MENTDLSTPDDKQTHLERSSKISLIILSFLLMVAIAVILYLLNLNQQLKKTLIQQANTQEEISELTATITETSNKPTPSTNPVDSWKKITFEKYDFSMKLPNGWAVSNDAMNGEPIELRGQETVVDDYRNLLHIYKINDKKLSFDFDMKQGIPEGISKNADDPEIDQILSTFKFEY